MAGENGNNASVHFLIMHLECVNEYFPEKESQGDYGCPWICKQVSVRNEMGFLAHWLLP